MFNTLGNLSSWVNLTNPSSFYKNAAKSCMLSSSPFVPASVGDSTSNQCHIMVSTTKLKTTGEKGCIRLQHGIP